MLLEHTRIHRVLSQSQGWVDGWMVGWISKGGDKKILEPQGAKKSSLDSHNTNSWLRRPSHTPGLPLVPGKTPKHICPPGALAFPLCCPHAHSKEPFQIPPTLQLSGVPVASDTAGTHPVRGWGGVGVEKWGLSKLQRGLGLEEGSRRMATHKKTSPILRAEGYSQGGSMHPWGTEVGNSARRPGGRGKCTLLTMHVQVSA